MDKNRIIISRKHFIKKAVALLLCLFVMMNTLSAQLNCLAAEKEDDGVDISEQDIATDTDAEEAQEDELTAGTKDVDADTRVVNGSTISSGSFKSSKPTWYSWRHNWSGVSYANSSRKVSNGTHFLSHCIGNLSDKSQACNDYVMNVLKSNGEMSSSEYVTASGGTFETWLTNHNYYSVYGGYRELVSGGSYTSVAASTIQSIQNGDILVWGYQNSDGSYSTKHISIGVIFYTDLTQYISYSKDSISTGEVCVFQSNGGSLSGGSSVVGLESVAYYLSGSNSTSSYGTALKIYRKKPVKGSVSVSKSTVSGENKEGVVFGLYKVSNGGKSYMSNTKNLSVTSLNLSSLNDTTVSAESGMLTKVATFTTDSSGKGVASITSGIKKAKSTAAKSGDWYTISVSSDGYTLNGLPIGDYIIIEEPDTINDDCWSKGGDYEGVTLGANTVRTSWTAKQSQGKVLSINGVYHDINTTDTSNESVNKLCDFGFGQGLQYYAAFTIENDSNGNNRVVSVLAVNEDDVEESVRIDKTSSDIELSAGNTCYDLSNAVYAVYDNQSSAASATSGNYKTLGGYKGTIVTGTDSDSNVLTDLKKGTYYIKEVSNPKGYALDQNVYTVDLTDKTKLEANAYTLKVTDKPQYNPIDVLVLKKDELDGKALENAEFTIKFYAAEYAEGVNPATKGVKATRSWVVKTDKDGYAKANNAYKVSGDDWYTDTSTGKTVFPLGTVTVQETKAPDGYLLDDTVYVYKISSSGSGYTVQSYKTLEVTDTPIPTISTSANDSISGSKNSQTSEKAVIYDDVYMTKLIVGKTYTIKGVLMDKETGEKLVVEDGNVTSEETFTATDSTMTVRMTYEFNSSALKGQDTVVFENLYEGGKKVAVHNDLNDEDQTVHIDETLVAFDKVDSSTGESIEGAELTLYDSQGNMVESWVSDGEEHQIVNLVPGTYTLTEETAPKGYKTAASITFELDYSFEKKTVTMEDDVITGGVHITKTDSVNPDKKLQGVTFELYKKADSIMNTAIDLSYVSDETKDGDLYIGSFVTDENGEISVDNLSYGSYYLVETETLETYDLLDEAVEFEIDEEHTSNELTIENVAHEGWIIYGSASQNAPGGNVTSQTVNSPLVKTGDETDILWIMVLMVTSLGMIVILVKKKKKTRELLVISALLFIGCRANTTVMAQETKTVNVGRTVETDYCDSEPEHDAYIMDTYTDPETGETYDVKLTFAKSECTESKNAIPTELKGTIGDYRAEYLIYNDKRYDNPGEDLSQLEDLIKDFMKTAGYPEGSYGNLSYAYDGQEYTGDAGVMYRDFKVTFDAYGSRYRFYYTGSVEIPTEQTSTQSSRQIVADTEDTAEPDKKTSIESSTESNTDTDTEAAETDEKTARIDVATDEKEPSVTTENSDNDSGLAETVPGNSGGTGTGSGTGGDSGSGGTGTGGSDSNIKNSTMGNTRAAAILTTVAAVIMLGVVTTYVLTKRRRTVTE